MSDMHGFAVGDWVRHMQIVRPGVLLGFEKHPRFGPLAIVLIDGEGKPRRLRARSR